MKLTAAQLLNYVSLSKAKLADYQFVVDGISAGDANMSYIKYGWVHLRVEYPCGITLEKSYKCNIGVDYRGRVASIECKHSATFNYVHYDASTNIGIMRAELTDLKSLEPDEQVRFWASLDDFFDADFPDAQEIMHQEFEVMAKSITANTIK